jgi:hypothetical protein
MLGTELINFVMQFIGDPKFFIVFSIVFYSVEYILFFEFVHHLYLIEVNHCSIGSATRDISHHICLNTDTHFNELLEKWYPEMNAWLS